MSKFTNVINSLGVGDRIVVPKSSLRLIQHHAIYIGWNDGGHWFIENNEGVGVRIIEAEQFFKDVTEVTRIVHFRPRRNYSREDLVRFALSKKGQKYDLVSYNCESFANEVQYNKVESHQSRTGVFLGLSALLLLLSSPFSRK